MMAVFLGGPEYSAKPGNNGPSIGRMSPKSNIIKYLEIFAISRVMGSREHKFIEIRAWII